MLRRRVWRGGSATRLGRDCGSLWLVCKACFFLLGAEEVSLEGGFRSWLVVGYIDLVCISVCVQVCLIWIVGLFSLSPSGSIDE